MIESSTQTPARGQRPLERSHLLSSSLRVLDHARDVERRATRASASPERSRLLERLASHREILARRAANVALAPAVSANELRDLRDAASRLVAVQGWVTRKLGMTRLN